MPAPVLAADTVADYAAVRAGAGLIDRSHHGVVEVAGRDRASFLHALLSNEIKALGPGQGCAATLLDVHGKVQVVLQAWILDDRILLVTPPGLGVKVVEALDGYLFSEKVELRDLSGERALFLLAGPQAPGLVERLAGATPPETAWSHVSASLDGVEARLVRGGGETGEPEVWVAVAATDGARAREALVAAGARPVGPAALEALRIEAGTPRFGADVDPTVLLPEIPFESLLSYTKGCYPGQELVVRVRDRGHVNRRLVGLVLEGEAVPAPGAEIVAEGTAVGHVTSATFSPGLRRPIALGFVRRQHIEPGTPLGVRIGAETVGATVSALPFTR